MADDEKKKSGFQWPENPMFPKPKTKEQLMKEKIKQLEAKAKRDASKRLLDESLHHGLYDKATVLIAKVVNLLIGSLSPNLGFSCASFYLKRQRMFNFMIVGASGCLLGWALFNGYRIVFSEVIAWIFTTLCVFFWNYFWNESWTFKYKNINKENKKSGS